MTRRRDILRVCSTYFRDTPREARMKLVAQVAKRHGVTVAEIMGKSRQRHIAAARQDAMRQMLLEFGDAAAAVGRMFGRDHTTVLHAVRKGNAAH